jgi:hypothetical protein
LWVSTITPVASLIAGSLLTLLGQSLTDRRITRRDFTSYGRNQGSARRDAELKNYFELQEELIKLSDTAVALHQTSGADPEVRKAHVAQLSISTIGSEH